MAEQRTWVYWSRRRYPSSAQDQLFAGLAGRWQSVAHSGPVLVPLADLISDTGLAALDAISALRKLAFKGLVTVAPTPQATDVGRDIVYAIWLESKPDY